jgi:hypothetical protein
MNTLINQLPTASYRLMSPMVVAGDQEARDVLTIPQGTLYTWRDGMDAIANHKTLTGETLTLFNTQAA